MGTNPKLVLILSGKRRCGKDFVADILDQKINSKIFLRPSAPLKWQFCQEHGLDYDEMLSPSSYKEQYRDAMVKWSEAIRETDPDIFLRLAIEQQKAYEHGVWIFVDARRLTDMKFFQSDAFKNSRIVRIRLTASEETRKKRGWTFTPGVDDKTTECGLDEYKDWDYIIENNGTVDELIDKLLPVIREANTV